MKAIIVNTDATITMENVYIVETYPSGDGVYGWEHQGMPHISIVMGGVVAFLMVPQSSIDVDYQKVTHTDIQSLCSKLDSLEEGIMAVSDELTDIHNGETPWQLSVDKQKQPSSNSIDSETLLRAIAIAQDPQLAKEL